MRKKSKADIVSFKNKTKELIKNRFQIINNIIIMKILILLNLTRITSNNEIYLRELIIPNITLKVKGIGNKNIFGHDPDKVPDSNNHPNEIHINGIKQDIVNYSYAFNQTLNIVELIWNNSINNCFGMFRNCRDIIEFDFKNFDTSGVTAMNDMFYGCSYLTSLNLSNFVTSNVSKFNHMFFSCHNLSSLNLGNFDFSQVTRIDFIFHRCYNLEFINLSNFDESKLIQYENMFPYLLENIVICINPDINQNKVMPQIKNKTCYTIDCSNDWKLKQKKIISETEQCVDNCSISEYPYEYNGKCYKNCSKGFIDDSKCKCENDKCLLCSQVAINNKLCTKCNTNYYQMENDPSNLGEYIDCYKEINGYYLDKNDSLFKKCYYRCETCEIKGDDITHNCLECNDNYFYKYSLYNNYYNCYENCTYYHYFDNENNYHCTLNLSCPDNYPILIPDKLECINITFNTDKINEKIDTTIINNEIYSSFKNIILKSTFSQEKEINSSLSFSIIEKFQSDYDNKLQSYYNNILQSYYNPIDYNQKTNFVIEGNNEEIYQEVINKVILNFDINNDKEMIFQGEDNFIFHITDSKNELDALKGNNNSTNKNSIIDLGECETLLKKHYKINENISLLIIKYEKISNISTERSLQYEVYEPYNKTKLNLSICENITIDIYIPIKKKKKTFIMIFVLLINLLKVLMFLYLIELIIYIIMKKQLVNLIVNFLSF